MCVCVCVCVCVRQTERERETDRFVNYLRVYNLNTFRPFFITHIYLGAVVNDAK